MMFYMETRYGSNTKYNLKLVNSQTTSASDLNGRFGNLETLIKWHYDDPVSKEEIYRNNVILIIISITGILILIILNMLIMFIHQNMLVLQSL